MQNLYSNSIYSDLSSLCDRDSNRVFKNSPHARQMKNSVVMTPPPIHINGKGNREVRTSLINSNCTGLLKFSSNP